MKMVMQLAGLMVVLALAIPSMGGAGEAFRALVGPSEPVGAEDVVVVQRTAPPAAAARTQSASRAVSTTPGRRGRATLKADARGHFVADAKMNRKRVSVLVDTGATSVAINRSTAKKIGLRLRDRDFMHPVSTANGQTLAAFATIRSIEIGRVEVRDVEAAVLEDSSLDGILLGMSFLGQLKRFEVKNGEMELVR